MEIRYWEQKSSDAALYETIRELECQMIGAVPNELMGRSGSNRED